MTKSQKIMKTSAMVLCLVGTSCALNYPYRHYALDLNKDELLRIYGKKDGSEDLPLSICESSDGDKFPCIVYPRTEHEKMQRKYFENERELVYLRKNCRR